MEIRPLAIAGAFEITPRQWSDDRGVFLEWYRADLLNELCGVGLELRQANTSVSRRGVVRGIHFADVPPGQAKHVTVTHGSALDIVVDVRVGSPTFGQWDSVLLDTVDRRAIYLAEGLGHVFIALEEGTTVSYLVSGFYDPLHERAVSPLDPDLAIDFRFPESELILSEKDLAAPTLADAARDGLLPSWDASSRAVSGGA